MLLKNFLISESSTLREALSLIEKNHHGIIFSTDSTGAVTGLATDGDVRRSLLAGKGLDDSISVCINRNFIWEKAEAPREILLKKLDSKIRSFPLLDINGHLVEVISKNHLPIQHEGDVFARSRSPVRVSFGGGGSDLTHHFSNTAGAVINATISLYSHASLRLRDDRKIYIKSLDLNDRLHASNLEEVLKKQGRFGLIQSLIQIVNPDFGFELFLHSDYPMNSGLGGSAAVAASVLGCFNQFRRDQWSKHEISEIAFQAERLHLGIPGGWQDQYATVFGGFNFIEFKMDQNIIHPLRISATTLCELEESLVLCDTGTQHDSGLIHEDQARQMQQKEISRQVSDNVNLTYRMRNDLLRGNLHKFGLGIHDGWNTKKNLSSKISNSWLDELYRGALNHGALGGKLLGAGGGGFFLFYVPPFRNHELISYLKSQKLLVQPFKFEQEGLCAWTIRDHKNYEE